MDEFHFDFSAVLFVRKKIAGTGEVVHFSINNTSCSENCWQRRKTLRYL